MQTKRKVVDEALPQTPKIAFQLSSQRGLGQSPGGDYVPVPAYSHVQVRARRLDAD